MDLKKVFYLFIVVLLTGFAIGEEVDICSDSDGGLNYFEKGLVNENSDYCTYESELSNLMEWYCDEGIALSQPYQCLNGCVDGACVEVLDEACSDSDGGNNIYLKGHLEDVSHGNAIYDDYCIDNTGKINNQGTYVQEYYCGPNNYQYEKTECENGCMNGECLPSPVSIDGCKDSDGMNFYSRGRTQSYDDEDYIEQEDYCREDGLGEDALMEGYCMDSGDVRFFSIVCENGCYDGVCLGDNDEIFDCEDSDAKNRFVKGYIEGSQYKSNEEEFLSLKSFYDSCSEKKEGAVSEFFCDSGMIVSETLDCENGCYDGACLSDDSDVCIDDNCGSGREELSRDFKEDTKENISICNINNLGYRAFGEYCSEYGFISQKSSDNICENSFECVSNSCIDSKCVKFGFWTRFFDWFADWFA